MPQTNKSSPPPSDPDLTRYSRQILVQQIGPDGQRRLAEARVLLVGCGALGTVTADMLVRAGVGFLRVCDRDIVEENNLQRQVLFDERDVASELPKAAVAARKLAAINSGVIVEPWVADVTFRNVNDITRNVHLVLDGTDNFETRYLLNDYCLSSGVPWVYAGVIGVTGLCMPVIPGVTACLRCLFEDPPPPELSPTCDTAGVLAPAAHVVASLQVVEATKILMGRLDEVRSGLTQVDVWSGRMTTLRSGGPKADCPACARREFPWLEGRLGGRTTLLCGRDAVQISPAPGAIRPDLGALAVRLAAAATHVRRNEHLLKASIGEFELTVFADGRVIVHGVTDPERARALQAKYVGT